MNRIDVYMADISKAETNRLIRRYNSLVPGADNRLAGIRNEKVVKQTAAGEIMLRALLARRLNIAPGALEIHRTDAGKPYLKAHPGVHFNLTHSADMVVCALGNIPLGVDIEKIEHARDRVIEKCFCGAEIDAINRAASRDVGFFRLWTMKEAYLKAEGLGFTVPPKSVDVTCIKSHFFTSALVDGSYCVSLCARGEYGVFFHTPRSIEISDITKK
ncbi:MAG: 4'-phosphopantetheinyl transferase superfamily protein [Clostridiales bacterium]|nr:4'-phosphopantetheinyl transferase superfamily protein [Clostridiales bacterium]